MKKLVQNLKLSFNQMDVETQDVTELATYDFSNFTPTNPNMLYYDEVNQFVSNGSIYVEFTSYYQQEGYRTNFGEYGAYLPEILPCHFIIRFIKQGSNLVIYGVYEMPPIIRYDKEVFSEREFFPVIGAIPSSDGSLIYCFYAAVSPYNGYVQAFVTVREANDMVLMNSGKFYVCGDIDATTSGRYNSQTEQYDYYFTPTTKISAACSNDLLSVLTKMRISNFNIVGTQLPVFSRLQLDEGGPEIIASRLLRVEGTAVHTDIGIFDIQKTELVGQSQLYVSNDTRVDAILYTGKTKNISNPLSVSGARNPEVQI